MANYHKDYAFLMDNHYSKQAEIAAEAIGRLDFPRNLPKFTYVDIGSHVGKLTGLVLDILAQYYPPIDVHCVEPDSETFQELQANIRQKEVIFYNANFQHWLRSPGQSLSGRVDILVNSHTFYHYPEYSWPEIIQESDKLLTPHGKHVVIIDSAGSSLNEIKPVLDSKIPNKRHDAFGRFLKGSDLEMYFGSAGINYTREELPSPIHFNDNEEALDGVCHMLGFVMRYNPDDVKKYAAKDVQDFMAQYKKGGMIVFPRNQDFFVLPKQ